MRWRKRRSCSESTRTEGARQADAPARRYRTCFGPTRHISEKPPARQLCADQVADLGAGPIEGASAKGHMESIMKFSFHMRSLRFAGSLLNHR